MTGGRLRSWLARRSRNDPDAAVARFYGYAEPPQVIATRNMPIVSGPFDMATGLWTNGCDFFRAHLL